jgi:hypothetical protein
MTSTCDSSNSVPASSNTFRPVSAALTFGADWPRHIDLNQSQVPDAVNGLGHLLGVTVIAMVRADGSICRAI